MPHTDPLLERTVQGWARLKPAQRERFFQAGLRAALRLERREFREWLRRRVSEPPLAATVDPASFAISKADIAMLMRSVPSNREDRRRNAISETKNADIFKWCRAAVPPQTHTPQRTPFPTSLEVVTGSLWGVSVFDALTVPQLKMTVLL
jgi:hypothetical protein